jgi:hypothetical protein
MDSKQIGKMTYEEILSLIPDASEDDPIFRGGYVIGITNPAAEKTLHKELIFDPDNVDIAQAEYDRMMAQKTPEERRRALKSLINKLKTEE